jgi:hypothetical protein
MERAPDGRRRRGILICALAAVALATVAVIQLRGSEPQVAPAEPAATSASTPADAAIERASAPLPSQVLPDAVPRECGAADRRGGSRRCIAPGGCQEPAPAAVAPDAAPPVRKVTRPRPMPRNGSDDDLSNSRL